MPQPPLNPEDAKKLNALFDRVTHLEQWRQGIRVDGATYFSNPATGMQISIPKPPTTRIETPVIDTVTVKIGGTVAGGGCYSGSLHSGALTVSGSANLAMPETLTATKGVLVLNLAETGTSGHTLSTNTYHVGKLVGANASGPIVAINGNGSAPFPVKITKDGGSAGTSSTAASWTYTVKDKSGTVTLGTGVALYRARAIGITNFASADSWGLAMYDGATLVLLDAYKEYRGKATC